jgi:hypothetical protein
VHFGKLLDYELVVARQLVADFALRPVVGILEILTLIKTKASFN